MYMCTVYACVCVCVRACVCVILVFRAVVSVSRLWGVVINGLPSPLCCQGLPPLFTQPTSHPLIKTILHPVYSHQYLNHSRVELSLCSPLTDSITLYLPGPRAHHSTCHRGTVSPGFICQSRFYLAYTPYSVLVSFSDESGSWCFHHWLSGIPPPPTTGTM